MTLPAAVSLMRWSVVTTPACKRFMSAGVRGFQVRRALTNRNCRLAPEPRAERSWPVTGVVVRNIDLHSRMIDDAALREGLPPLNAERR